MICEPKTRDAQFDALCRELIPSQDGPGMAVGLYQGGRSLFLKGYGRADLEQGTPITPQTVFHIASVSKQFTTFAIALLAREGKVDLEADIGTYLPYFPDFGQRVTVNHLIHNTSGIRDQWSLFQLGGQELDNRLRQLQVVSMIARQRGLNFEPGAQFMYSNTNFTLLAEIVLAVTGQTLRQFTTERIFSPLGMDKTFFYDDVTEVVPGRAHSYVKGKAGQWHRALLNYDNAGATSLCATVEDFAQWSRNFGHPIVGDAVLIEQISTMGALRDKTPINYGFGLWRGTYAGHHAIEHSGGDAGFRSWFAYFPGEDFGIAAFANFPFESFSKLIEAGVDLCLNGTDLRDHTPAAAMPDAALLDALAGSYLDDFAPMVTLERTDDGLMWRSGKSESKMLVFRADGTFDLGATTQRYNSFRVTHDSAGQPAGFQDITTSRGAVGRTVLNYRRVEPVQPTTAQLTQLAGEYRCPELDITYVLSVEQGGLSARSLWSAEPIVLKPSLADRFDSGDASISIVEFTRDAQGEPIGARVHGGRIRHIRFDKVS